MNITEIQWFGKKLPSISFAQWFHRFMGLAAPTDMWVLCNTFEDVRPAPQHPTWWYCFKAYWRWYRHVRLQPIFAMEFWVRTPLFALSVLVNGQSPDTDHLRSGIRVTWFPAHWSLRLNARGQSMYRHEHSWGVEHTVTDDVLREPR